MQKALTEANDAKTEGNKLFGSGQYEDALLLYELALQVAADMPASIEIRSICHANRVACFSNLETIRECTKDLELNHAYMKALTRRVEAHEKRKHFEEAVMDMKRTVELDPSNNQSRRSIVCLEPLAAENQEKMKEEMISGTGSLHAGTIITLRFRAWGEVGTSEYSAESEPSVQGSYTIATQKPKWIAASEEPVDK
ncbi:hypothetical protein MKW98_010431 [Papaver atlanticum]|uniref:Uncharacterized protein n=1 Tax=Papaver atlanticum TaxID=357466 RepID=A0AAD4T882_9MAGN|nr:hypothetical protein MKW98_010431 [Papaver atlanticum]